MSERIPPLGASPLSNGDEVPVAAARAAIAAQLKVAATDPEAVPLAQALGRVLAADLRSPIAVPAHDNSAMDGFAFDGALLGAVDAAQPLRLAVGHTVHAGDAQPTPVAAGHCARIMTGAVMPPGTDTVVPLELCRSEAGRVSFSPTAVRRGDNRRLRGEDLALGSVALASGHVLRPADVGLIASLGIAEVPVRRRLRVALFSTGNELCEPGQPLLPGCIYDSNRASLRAALQRLGVEVLDLGLVRDEPAALQTTLEHAAREADAIVTSGGVSMGDADHTREVLARMGEVAFWKVAMRPGRPFAFGPVRHSSGGGQRTAWLFALPGNPVAALVTFHVFVRDALRQLAGGTSRPALRVMARCLSPIRKRPGRSEYQRGILSRAEDGPHAGSWLVRLTGSQGAGVLRSMSLADGLIVLGPDQGSVAEGDVVEVMPLADDGP